MWMKAGLLVLNAKEYNYKFEDWYAEGILIVWFPKLYASYSTSCSFTVAFFPQRYCFQDKVIVC